MEMATRSARTLAAANCRPQGLYVSNGVASRGLGAHEDELELSGHFRLDADNASVLASRRRYSSGDSRK